ncbi:MAG TPA: sugar diacid recognition domain-containing protein [Bacilli bacterium]|nr:sugar diacid recognition domain-containing protein [Bacilli bacterium]
MILTRTLAEQIVAKTMESTHLRINVMNREGIILSSSDPNRVNTFHEAAYRVVQTGDTMMISAEESAGLTGTLPGLNMPILFGADVVGVIGISGRPEEVVPFGQAVKMMTEMMLQQAYLMEQLITEQRSRDYLAQELITGGTALPRQALVSRGDLLGIDLTRRRSVILLQLDGAEEEIERWEKQTRPVKQVSSLFPDPHQVLVTSIRRDRWLIITDLSQQKDSVASKTFLYQIVSRMVAQLRTGRRLHATFALGNAYDDLRDLPFSFREASRVLDILQRFPKLGPVKHVDDVALELMLTEISDASRQMIVRETLGRLRQHPDLLQTLRAFFDHNLQVKQAAEALKIHRNTFLYRLERIEQLLGVNPREFQQAVRLQVGLMLLEEA